MRYYVLFEGIDGSGKTSLVSAVAEFIQKASGITALVTREPGSTSDPICSQIRDMVKSGLKISREAEVFLFMADRAQHTEMVVKPALSANKVVLQDRGFLSTYAYQGHGRGWNTEDIYRLNRMSAIRPDLIVLMNTDLEVSWGRIKDRMIKDPFEAKIFQAKVHNGFQHALKVAAAPASQFAYMSVFPWEPPPILRVNGQDNMRSNTNKVVDTIFGVTNFNG